MKKRLVQTPWFYWIVFFVALELIAISVNYFYAPINIAAGGATGIAILVDAAFGIERSLTVLIVNLLMILLAWIFLDKKTVKNIIVGSFSLPLLMYLTPSQKIITDDLLAVIVGGAVFALGVAALYRINASSGGTTVPPMIFKKYFHLNPAFSLLAIDMLVTFFNIFVSGLNAFFMASFSLVITSLVMRYTEAGLDHKYQVQVMSQTKLPEIKQMLESEDHAMTIFNVRGGYSANEKELLMAVIDNQSYGPLLAAVHDIDPDAFIIASNVVKVHGGTFGI
ncbi:YitT family protein [Ligilactobacillus faecis]|uniref:YitT family protein n=1 Tax=Ligilactobacillus faecis TaxID=762833 RepID=A0ABV4DS47_9LACO|nr:YitT family protein [Ligilactobacillus faecis]WGN89740.1 YitT family protein [Ligilactobacillus faecis]